MEVMEVQHLKTPRKVPLKYKCCRRRYCCCCWASTNGNCTAPGGYWPSPNTASQF